MKGSMTHPFVVLAVVTGALVHFCGSGGYAPAAAMFGWLMAMPFCFQYEQYDRCRGDWFFFVASTTGIAAVFAFGLRWLESALGAGFGWPWPMNLGWWPPIVTLVVGLIIGVATFAITRQINKRMEQMLVAEQEHVLHLIHGHNCV